MRFSLGFAAVTLVTSVLARRDPTKWNRKDFPAPRVLEKRLADPQVDGPATLEKRAPPVIKQTEAVKKFAINGAALPEVDFDIGEAYAGLLPIGPGNNVSELYFFFTPSTNPAASDEILIWLNGGPGCSSLEGLLQEIGPLSWQYGTFKPVKNPYTWSNLTNVVYVEQPAGTGFSPQKETKPAEDEVEVAKQFLGFWKNFVDTFDLHNRKIFIVGESYAGYYVPYIADAMHNETNLEYYGVESIMIYDPELTYYGLERDISAVPFVDKWSGLFNLNQSYTDDLHKRHESCGYQKFMEEAYVFPPKGKLPTPPHVDREDANCRLSDDITAAAQLINPCWDVYQVATTCPVLWDVLGFPGTFYYLPEGTSIYFNRTDVQKAINAPLVEWKECTDIVLKTDNSEPSSWSVLPRIIDKNKRTIIAHAELDFIYLKNASIIAVQNMTWGGAQGFSKAPEQWNKLYVPYHSELSVSSYAGAGHMGTWHTERNLTLATVDLSGHMIPQYAPSVAYRTLEFMLGRIGDLGEVSDFTTQSGDFGNNNATMRLV